MAKKRKRKVRSDIRFTTYTRGDANFRCEAMAIDAMECAARLIHAVEKGIGEEKAKNLLEWLTARLKRSPQKKVNA